MFSITHRCSLEKKLDSTVQQNLSVIPIPWDNPCEHKIINFERKIFFFSHFFHQLDHQDTKLVWKKKKRKKKLFSHWLHLERGFGTAERAADVACVCEGTGQHWQTQLHPKVGYQGRWDQCCQNDLLFPLLSCPGSWLRTSKTCLNTVIWPYPLPWLWKGSPHREPWRAEPLPSVPLLIPRKSGSVVFALAMYLCLCFVLRKNLLTYLIKSLKSIFFTFLYVMCINCRKVIKHRKIQNPKL